MKHLHLDIETYSPESIVDTGVYKYAMHPEFQILLCAFAWDDDPVKIIEWGTEPSKELTIVSALQDPNIVKHAHNATFERVCFSMELRRRGEIAKDQWLDPAQWQCSMVQCIRCGLPASLDQAGAALGLPEQKMKEGKALIKLFCLPHEETKNALFASDRRAHPEDYPEQWETFKRYCIRDVEVEQDICRRTDWYPVSEFERNLYAIDQRINDRGVLIDQRLVSNAISIDAKYKARLNIEAVKLSGLSNPNSVSQLKDWIKEQTGIELDSLNKDSLPDLRKQVSDPRVLRILDIRNEMRKTSCQKYSTMQNVAGPDGRVRGVTQFHGSRTGRWAGRLVQMQNLPQNHITDLEFARQALLDGDEDLIEMCYGNVPDVLSQLIRTSFIAPAGQELAVCDFSAIEARVLAWLAGEKWVLDVFSNGGDIYCATASQMFHVPVEKHGQNSELRQKGKIAVLALGYGGGVGALDKMGGQKMGMTPEEERETVDKWRKANPNIVRFWKDVETAVRQCLAFRTKQTVGCISVSLQKNGTLTIQLPSGRHISYPKMGIAFANEWAFTGQTPAQEAAASGYINKEKKSLHLEKYWSEGRLHFMGVDQTTKKWGWIETHGGKLVENITQAVARDCLAETMTTISDTYHLPIIFHVHDEIICEISNEQQMQNIQASFAMTPAWAKGLPLKGAGYTTPFYKKD